MFNNTKLFKEYTDQDKQDAKTKYLNAISASVQGTAVIILKREVKDIFVNGYNKNIMRLHTANHDLQICIDQYSCAQYICSYLTKNESGICISIRVRQASGGQHSRGCIPLDQFAHDKIFNKSEIFINCSPTF